MKVVPVASNHAMTQTVATTNQTAARERAIARLTTPPGAPVQATPAPTTGQQQQHPVANANNISVEEMGAIQAPKITEEIDNSTQDVDTQAAEVAAEEPAQQQKDPELEKKFAQLARQERLAVQRNRELKAREADLKAREEALKTAQAPQQQPDLSNYVSKDQLKRDAFSVLSEVGITYDELTQQAMAAQNTDPRLLSHIKRLEAQLDDLNKAREQAKQQQQEQQQSAYQAALNQIERDATTLVKQDPSYEAIRAVGKGAVKEVVKLIKETFDQDGYVMSVEEAASLVEQEIVEQESKRMEQLSKIDKIQRRRLSQSNATTKTAPKQTQAPVPQQTQPMKTLTNATSSTRKLSARERAILRFKGENF